MMSELPICPLLSGGALGDAEVRRAEIRCLRFDCAWYLEALDMCAVKALADAQVGMLSERRASDAQQS